MQSKSADVAHFASTPTVPSSDSGVSGPPVSVGRGSPTAADPAAAGLEELEPREAKGKSLRTLPTSTTTLSSDSSHPMDSTSQPRAISPSAAAAGGHDLEAGVAGAAPAPKASSESSSGSAGCPTTRKLISISAQRLADDDRRASFSVSESDEDEDAWSSVASRRTAGEIARFSDPASVLLSESQVRSTEESPSVAGEAAASASAAAAAPSAPPPAPASAGAAAAASSSSAAPAAASDATDDDDDDDDEDEIVDPKDIPNHVRYGDNQLDIRPLQGVLLPVHLRNRIESMRDLLCDLVTAGMDTTFPSDLAILIGLFAVTQYRSREVFSTAQLYAQYVKRTLRAGMQVRVRVDSTETSDNVREMQGLYGIFLHSNMARPPCRCFWPGDGPPLKWINWSDIELLTDDECDPSLVRDAQRELLSYDWQQFGVKGAPSKNMVVAVLETRIASLERALEANGVKPAWDEEDF